MVFRKTSKHNHLGFLITNAGDPNTAVRENIIMAKVKLIQRGPFLRSSS